MPNHLLRSAALVFLVVIGSITAFSQEGKKRVQVVGEGERSGTRKGEPGESGPERDALQMIKEGRQTFRFDTFGDEEFWKGQATAIAELNVSGDTPPAPELTPSEPGRITGDGLNADVSVENAKMSGTARIVFRLTDSSDTPITDLQPYMGAMGHLVIISADGKQYVHAHPAEETTTDGKVEFEAHSVMPGIYKAWGQFQRVGKVHVVPFVSNFSWYE
jgi:hypothetical protein